MPQSNLQQMTLLIFFSFSERKKNVDMSCKSSSKQMIHMKCQDLFSLKKKNKNKSLEYHLLQILLGVKGLSITKTRLFKYIENFTTKNENFQMKNSGIFHISAQIIDCGYSLERVPTIYVFE